MSQSAEIDTLGVGRSCQERSRHVIEPVAIEDCASHRLELRYQDNELSGGASTHQTGRGANEADQEEGPCGACKIPLRK